MKEDATCEYGYFSEESFFQSKTAYIIKFFNVLVRCTQIKVLFDFTIYKSMIGFSRISDEGFHDWTEKILCREKKEVRLLWENAAHIVPYPFPLLMPREFKTDFCSSR